MTAVFLDTSGLIATWDRRDQWHGDAAAIYRDLIHQRYALFTTTYVLLECANAVSRKPYRNEVDDLRKVLAQAGTLIFPTDEDWQSAWNEYRQLPPGSAGVVDLISFRVMRALGLTDAFTNDSHFRTAGLTTLF